MGRDGHVVRFRATVHRSETVMRAVLAYFKLSEDHPGVAILSELDTGAGQASGGRGTKISTSRLRDARLRYPLHIAEIRQKYESQGLFSNRASDAIRASGELREKAEAASQLRDVLPDQTAGSTAISENRVLAQTLRYLEDGRFRVIGIIATDPHDAVFLARLIRLYCPDARVFAVISDLLYLDPESITDLRGMIIGSTYPLYPVNHEWTGSDEASRGQVFPSQHAQGGYNAMTILLNRMIDGEETKNLLEYSVPPALLAPGADRLGMPPVWISVVGERSLFPIDCRARADGEVLDDGYLCAPASWPWHKPGPKMPVGGPLKVTRVVGWMVVVGLASAAIVAYQVLRLRALSDLVWGEDPEHRHPFPMPADQDRFAALTILVAIAYLYLAGPAWRFDIGLFAHPAARALLQAVIVVTIALSVFVPAALAWMDEAPFGGRTRARRIRKAALIEQVGLVAAVIVAVFVSLATIGASRPPGGKAWDTLRAVRSVSLSGGVSPIVPAGFAALAVVSWAYASSRIARVSRMYGLREDRLPRPIANGGPDPGGPGEAMRETKAHRMAFDALFHLPWTMRHPDPPEVSTETFSGWLKFAWHQPWVRQFDLGRGLALILAIGVAADMTCLRPLSPSGEGWLFDWTCRAMFGALLLLIAWQAARLSTAWRELHATLSGFAQLLDRAFVRIPNRITSWLFYPEACRSEYGVLIRRQLAAIRDLRTKARGRDLAFRLEDEFLVYLNVIEFFNKRPIDPADEDKIKAYEDLRTEVAREFPDPPIPAGIPLGELDAVRYLARHLAPIWARRPVSEEPDGDEKEKLAGPTPESKLICFVEDLLALEATRWIGGALARIWTLIGFLVVASLLLLFGITSYPFPEQPRVISVMGLVIVAILVLVLRVVLGSSRDQVISRIGNTTPGKVSWDSSLFSSLGAYVVPLVGVLAAISFDATDLFRSVLGPILRLFP